MKSLAERQADRKQRAQDAQKIPGYPLPDEGKDKGDVAKEKETAKTNTDLANQVPKPDETPAVQTAAEKKAAAAEKKAAADTAGSQPNPFGNKEVPTA